MSASPGWIPAPERPVLELGWVHVFRLQLDLPPGTLQRFAALLSSDERTRASRYLREIDQQRFAAGRGQLRRILAAYLDLDPARLRFRYNPRGKPSLEEGEPRFNLSHSRELGLLAIITGQEVGIDIETGERNVDYTNIARRFFSPGEAAALLALPPDQQPRAFLNGWTRKEAYIKARGQGLSIPLDTFEVTLDDPPQLTGPSEPWSLYALDPGGGFTAALVVEGTVQGIRCWDWQES